VNSTLKSLALVGAGMLAAGAGFWIWQQYFSRDAQIAALHRACLDEFATVRDKLKSGLVPKSDSTFLKGFSEGLGKALEDMSGGVGDAVCDAVRDACRVDFDGRICTAARERYP
jgi:hypothetical protein